MTEFKVVASATAAAKVVVAAEAFSITLSAWNLCCGHGSV